MRRTDGARGLPLHTRIIYYYIIMPPPSSSSSFSLRSCSPRAISFYCCCRYYYSSYRVRLLLLFSPAAPSVLLQHRLCVHCACSCHRARHARPAIGFRPIFLLPLYSATTGEGTPRRPTTRRRRAARKLHRTGKRIGCRRT